ncbi:S-adenosyl-L-methionine-dependent methyltransferase [Plectosphaerella plurivora]|uniref:S-adenosyl-L-methionine-dependent methyltransferase n=1 Tax=Plectosphaerella plurivora TaxID=936078 RepID=A0A9P8V2D9_9PEZI|nr:S-adenosyl-L-methionine-dependent methyltransferase [Plectosphaerella plurivora]
MSLVDSIVQYRTINGRTYHSERGDAQYWVTNDELSNEALDINHHVLTLLKSGKLYRSPLSPNIKVPVDIGTGTGIWAIDFADEFPGAEVIGTDLSPIQPNWIPPNLQFQIDDCTRPWSFEPNSLDFVHIRLLVGSIADWPSLFAKAFLALRPGGWIESHESSPVIRSDDSTLTPGGAMEQWGPVFLEGGQRTGRTFAVLEDGLQRKGMEAAGFVDIHEADYKLPIGPWARGTVHREAGRFFQAAVLQDVEGTLTFIANVLGWSEREIAGFGAHYRSEVTDTGVHAYFSQKTVWAMKPGGEGCPGG